VQGTSFAASEPIVVRGGGPRSSAEAVAALRAEGLAPRPWANAPGDRYGWHRHPYHKRLYCVQGSIVFHTRNGDLALAAGDRLELPAAVDHAATVGADGVACVEAAVASG
jgi:quercetin dioxygenase-like cupin family protein